MDEVVAALIKREQNGSTGFGKGVAVPHVKHAKVKKMAGTVGRSRRAGIDFSALDHQPVYSIVLLLSPEHQPQHHLQAMNVVFSNLQEDMFRRFLRQSDTQGRHRRTARRSRREPGENPVQNAKCKMQSPGFNSALIILSFAL